MKKRLGRLEQQLFAYVQLRPMLRTLRTGDLIGPPQITANRNVNYSSVRDPADRAGGSWAVCRPERLPRMDGGVLMRAWI